MQTNEMAARLFLIVCIWPCISCLCILKKTHLKVQIILLQFGMYMLRNHFSLIWGLFFFQCYAMAPSSVFNCCPQNRCIRALEQEDDFRFEFSISDFPRILSQQLVALDLYGWLEVRATNAIQNFVCKVYYRDHMENYIWQASITSRILRTTCKTDFFQKSCIQEPIHCRNSRSVFLSDFVQYFLVIMT